MTYLVHHYQPSTRLDHYELDGLLNVLDRKIAEHGEAGEYDTAYYVGAWLACSIFRHHEFVETQDDFMRLFENRINELLAED